MSKKFIVEVQETEEGDLIIEFPQEIIDEMGLMEGDELDYDLTEDGQGFIIKKAEQARYRRDAPRIKEVSV